MLKVPATVEVLTHVTLLHLLACLQEGIGGSDRDTTRVTRDELKQPALYTVPVLTIAGNSLRQTNSPVLQSEE